VVSTCVLFSRLLATCHLRADISTYQITKFLLLENSLAFFKCIIFGFFCKMRKIRILFLSVCSGADAFVGFMFVNPTREYSITES